MTKDQKELQAIYNILSLPFVDPLDYNHAIQRLEKLATKERHPEGSDHLLTGKSWQELDIMLRFAVTGAPATPAYEQVCHILDTEIERRLLALIPKD